MNEKDLKKFKDAELIASTILEALDEPYKKDASERWHPSSNSASDIGNPCLRYQVLRRLEPEERKPREIAAAYRMAMGRDQEARLIVELNTIGRAVGFSIESSQQFFHWKEPNIKGKIDGKLRWDSAFTLPELKGKIYPIEIKHMGEYSFKNTNSISDFNSRWTRNYVSQLTTYLYMHELEIGFFILGCPGHRPKMLPYFIDYQLADEIEKRAMAAERWFNRGQIPPFEERGNVSAEDCQYCDFNHVCLPDLQLDSQFILFDKQTEEQTKKDLARIDEIKKALNETPETKKLRKELEELEDSVKEKVRGLIAVPDFVGAITGMGLQTKKEFIVGDWLLTGKISSREYKAKPATEAHTIYSIISKISRLIEEEKEEEEN